KEKFFVSIVSKSGSINRGQFLRMILTKFPADGVIDMKTCMQFFQEMKNSACFKADGRSFIITSGCNTVVIELNTNIHFVPEFTGIGETDFRLIISGKTKIVGIQSKIA